ncbi:hypothetical protein N0B44_26325 [Roseibacterium beibuensis]|uniref:hypothetical protein n=1 Tax=[Roseibacterium] beibuensis TaxID=1193142 RepID=UPI00217CE1F0|nr:hypothetical protein [Roseibacterium beibuensis]MCS6626443.1 hypothetical protein [Roseibacterium beibuensis]
MRRGLCITLAIAAAAVAAPTSAQTFGSFKQFCLETQGEPDRVQAALSEAGWETDPRAASLPAGMSVMLMSDPSTGTPPKEMAMFGFMPSQTGLSLPTCSVMGVSRMDDLIRQMTDWAGFEPGQTAEGSTLWVYTIGPDGLTPQPDLYDAGDAEIMSAARSQGTLHMTQVREAQAGPFLLHIRVSADAATIPTH